VTDEIISSGYCRAMDGNRILVCELADDGGLDTGCKYPQCVYAPSCTLIQQVLLRAQEERTKQNS
jgi:hypothetical protein